jgi:CSLREA domain-containing protein
LKLALVALLFVALPQVFSAHARRVPDPGAGILFFVSTVDDHDDGVCNADCTLREAIRAANSNPGDDDGIEFTVTGTINLTSALPDITGGVSIDGPGANLLTVRRFDSDTVLFRIFNVMTTGTVVFSGLTISNGQATDNAGGGISKNGAGTVTIADCTVSGNTAVAGSGGVMNIGAGTMYVTNSTIAGNKCEGGYAGIGNSGVLIVTKSTISDNVVAFGPGGGIGNTGTANVTNSTISGNTSRGGGGISNGGILNVTETTIIGNDALIETGGGISNIIGTMTIADCTISGNIAAAGGGVSNRNAGTVNVTNSTVIGNSGGAAGGGIYTDAGTVNVTNSTIIGNSGGAVGGGIYTVGTSLANIKSSIIALNAGLPRGLGPDAFGDFTSAGFNLIGKTDDSTGFNQPTDLTGTVASPLDPGLDPSGLQDNGGPTQTIALLCGSAAIDKGTSNGLTGALSLDQRGKGFPRTIDDPLVPNANDIQGDGTDIGAFELNTQNCNHPPVAQCKNIQVSAGANCQASITAADVDNGSFDPDKGDSIATRALDNYGPFGLGPHTVTLTVTDTHGASSSCTATVTVVDTTPPTVTCPLDVSVPAAPGQCQAVVTYSNPTVSDNCSGAMLVGCVPPSGSTFQIGVTTVICTAKDAANNMSSCSFTVTVNDTQPPTITCPPNMTTVTNQDACPNPACKIVTYPNPVVQDNCPGVTFVCNPPSGSCFPTGVTTVTCTASDTAGNTASCNFTVTTFDVALQDDSNPSIILLWNSITGSYRFCCNGITFTGVGKASIQGCVNTLEHNPADRRVLARVDKSVHTGNASLQAPAGTLRCTITDRNTLNDTNLVNCQ